MLLVSRLRALNEDSEISHKIGSSFIVGVNVGERRETLRGAELMWRPPQVCAARFGNQAALRRRTEGPKDWFLAGLKLFPERLEDWKIGRLED